MEARTVPSTPSETTRENSLIPGSATEPTLEDKQFRQFPFIDVFQFLHACILILKELQKEWEQSHLNFLAMIEQVYQEKNLKGHGIVESCRLLAEEEWTAAQLIEYFHQLIAINYLIINQHIIFQSGIFMMDFDQVYHLKNSVEDFSDLANILTHIDPRYHSQLLMQLGSDFLQDLMSHHPQGLIEFLKELSGPALSFVVQNVLDAKIDCAEQFKEAIGDEPEKLISCLERLSEEHASELFAQLKLSDVQLEKFARQVYEHCNRDFAKAIQFLNQYCKQDGKECSRVVLVFNEKVYRPYLLDKQTHLSCWAGLFSGNQYQKKIAESKALHGLNTIAELKAMLGRMESKKLKGMTRLLVEAAERVDAAGLRR